jgi:hypothetical protein
MSSINWKAHGASLRKDIQKRTHLIKLVHGILPTNAKLHRQDITQSRCPACGQGPETWQHILKCPHEARKQWRATLLRTLHSTCKDRRTDPQIQHILHTAVSRWLEHTDPRRRFHLNPEDFPTAYRRLIRQQNLIGWEQLIQGRFSTEWSTVQDNFYARQLNCRQNKIRTGQRWQVAIIRVIWAQWFLLWEMRNRDLHGADTSSRAKAARAAVEYSLREIYDMRTHMEPSVQALLCKDITSHYTKSIGYNQNWLAVYGPLVRASIKRAKDRAIQNVRPITNWLFKKSAT